MDPRRYALGTRLALAAVLTGAATGIAGAARGMTSDADVVMLLLLAVVFAAYALGRAPGLLSAALGVAAYNFFFVAPLYTFAVADPRNLFTFAMLFVVGWTVSALAERLRREEAAALSRRTDELRSALLSSVSHDLRTPLATITGAASTLLDPLVLLGPEARAELLGFIREEAQRLEGLVSNLLEMSRLAAGPVALKKEWVPVEELVGTALRRMDGALNGRPVTTALPATLLLVEGDPVLLGQVLVNLLENVARHTPAGTAVRIEAGKSAEGVRISVIDAGPGLPPNDPATLFEPFERGADPRGPGTGLGLAICRGIARAHGGDMHAETLATGGAAFSLVLPCGVPPTFPEDHA